ncbi:MAG TPA: PilZ domain-containing protein [Candidatus Methylomirabilis sp.]|nr:PilZ domain-containing protein [Candidatus Methylomirabilis sp.]
MSQATEEPARQTRRHPRIILPNGMNVIWHGGDLQLFSRVKTLSMGGLFIAAPNPPAVGTKIRLAFEVPGGSVRAEAVVRNVVPGEGLGVEFTRMELRDKLLLQRLLNRLLQTIA